MPEPVTLREVLCLFDRLGYVQVHVWYETHGNGGQVTLQHKETKGRAQLQHSESPVVPVTLVSYNREHLVDSIREQHRNEDYLKAAEILKPPQFDEHDKTGNFLRLAGRRYISVCCTAASEKYLERDHSRKGKGWHVGMVAGHGDTAAWTKVEDDFGDNELVHSRFRRALIAWEDAMEDTKPEFVTTWYEMEPNKWGRDYRTGHLHFRFWVKFDPSRSYVNEQGVEAIKRDN